MFVLLKLYVPTLVFVMVARAQVDICDNVAVLAATPTPQILTSVSIETDSYNLIYCTVQITVPAGSSLRLNFTSFLNPFLDPAFVHLEDPFDFSEYLVGVSYNYGNGYGPPVYVFPGSVYISIEYDITPSSTFVMTYEEVPFEKDMCNMMPLVIANSTVQELVTPNFGNGPYYDMQLCIVEIRPSNASIGLVVTFFDMLCFSDDVFICNNAFCTSLCSTSQRIFRGNPLFVAFFTDDFNGSNGMRLEYAEEFTEWTPWMTTSCSGDCTISQLNDTRTRTCNLDSCLGEATEERTRVCESYCSNCVLP